ncbi:hypothetical protein F4804DRAFT_332412 [Jackrogersella minutella]|nr:hypothetical protein F4804DRAFT_332412 [Jackrogersella minutella]
MPEDGFYFDAPGPRNYRAPWLTFSSNEFLCPEPQPRKNAQIPQSDGPLRPTGDDRAIQPPRKRQRLQHSDHPSIISLLSSDDEGELSSAESSPKNRRHKQKFSKIVSIEDVRKGMAEAKRLSRAAITSHHRKEATQLPPLEDLTRVPLGVKRLGPHINSFEIKSKKLLKEMGVLKYNPKREGLSDPNGLENITYGITEWVIPNPGSPNRSNRSSTPPSSFIPLDVD